MRAVVRHMDDRGCQRGAAFAVYAGVKRIDTTALNHWLRVAAPDWHFLQRETDAIAGPIFDNRMSAGRGASRVGNG